MGIFLRKLSAPLLAISLMFGSLSFSTDNEETTSLSTEEPTRCGLCRFGLWILLNKIFCGTCEKCETCCCSDD